MRELWPVLAAVCFVSVGGGLRMWLAPPAPNALVGYRARGVAQGPRPLWDAANRLLGRLMVVSGVLQVAALAVFVWASPLWARHTALACIILLVAPPIVLTDRAVKAWQAAATDRPPRP